MSEFSLSESADSGRYLGRAETSVSQLIKSQEFRWEVAARRAMDVMIAGCGLVFLMPLLLVVAILIKLQDGGPIFFAQPRLGRAGRMFNCWKLRTMVVDAQARLDDLLSRDPAARREWERDHKLKSDPRITALGSFLRKSSIDELPQLINVLLGEMSIVGPRPIVRAEIPRYARRFEHYCSVKPGLTGLWQVSGRNNTTYRRRVAMDSLYARRRTLMMDVAIILATVPAVLQSRGSY
jgi:lipopolysaccharide/colanic/teichoic acid biosynthesis glycosyltransferase